MEKRGNMRNSRDDNLWAGVQESNLGHASQRAPHTPVGHSHIAKAEGRVVQQVKRPPRDRKELERYLRIADDFADSHRYETLSATILRCLAAGIIP
jgi:hypothetical protein